ncbi:GFA family protein [Falsiroseomonas sp.]|uniref:GFA family protein n=1 Tax=Falsiroseomonas sp. TaxID=2870721 RepID=UPI0035654BD8
MKVDGRCHCGRIAYEAEIDPGAVMVCHCTDCQALSGSAFRTVALTRPGGFRLLSGELKTYVKVAESGARRHQGFCPDCGSPIYSTSEGDEPKVYSLRLGTCTQRAELVPVAQIWSGSALPWLGELPAIARRPKG